MNLAPAERAVARDRALAERRRTAPDTYAPFTIDEYRGMPLDYGYLDQCVAWPTPPPAHPAARVVPPGTPYPDVPVLVLSGEFDDITSAAEGAVVAAQFPRARHVILANSFHVNAMPRSRSDCGAEIARRFIATLDAGGDACASAVPPLRLVARFARQAGDLEPAVALAGNRADEMRLRIAAAAVAAIGDAWVRAEAAASTPMSGLRGGSFCTVTHGSRLRTRLYQVRWTEDVSVSGALERPQGRGGDVLARIDVVGPQGIAGRLRVRWREGVAEAHAVVRGSLGGKVVNATMSAP